MAFPFDIATGFETAANPFTSSSGTLISYPHFTALAREGMAPYRGAYCMRIKLVGGTTSQYLQEDTAVDVIDDAETWYFRWYFYLGKDFTMGASDKFSMVEFESTANTTTEVAAGLVMVSGVLNFWYNETIAAATPGLIELGNLTLGSPACALGKWYCAEIKLLLDAAAGTIQGFINDGAGSIVTGLAQSVIVDMRFGTLGVDAGTSGTVLYDDVILDDAQIYRDKERYPTHNRKVYFANDHPIIGRGRFTASLTGTGTNAVAAFYDTDGIPTSLNDAPGSPIRNLTANEVVPTYDELAVNYGLYVVLTGTAPELSISICDGGVIGEGAVKSYGAATKTPLPR